MRAPVITARFGAGWALVAACLLAACENSGLDLGFPPEETGTIEALVYLDRDGSRTPTFPLDTLYPGARVALLQRGSGDTVTTTVTGQTGIARFTSVPLGEYRLGIVTGSLGDSIAVGRIDSSEVRLETTPDTLQVTVARLSYPEVSLREARNLPQGKRVFVRGVVLVGVQAFRDTTSHVSDSSGAMRLTRVSLRGGLTGNNPGDSVSVLGITSTRAGQVVLDQAVVSRFGTRPPPIPNQTTTGIAATAANGTLDANLVQITGATISDTATDAPDFRATISDGSGSLVVLLDGNLNFVRSAFRPGRVLDVRGVLVPDGVGGWSLKPRDPVDAILF
ncbi:MAG: hypothetical protein AB7R55_20360 [Gemmatimonadales bacterium]